MIAGFLSGGLALGVGELVAGLTARVQSLVIAVGDVFVDNTPGDATEAAIRAVGTADKPILLTTIVVATLLVGALAGWFAARRYRLLAASMFAGFGLIGGWAGARHPQASAPWAYAAALAAAAAGRRPRSSVCYGCSITAREPPTDQPASIGVARQRPRPSGPLRPGR